MTAAMRRRVTAKRPRRASRMFAMRNRAGIGSSALKASRSRSARAISRSRSRAAAISGRSVR